MAPPDETLAPPARPVLTFPDEVAAFVRAHYAKAATILEYGSGGSTVLAAEMGGKRIFSVESDAGWAAALGRYLDHAGLSAGITLHHADIGPTGKWGRPRSDRGWRGYHAYPLSVWDRPDFVAPDLILIDGRFRPACLMVAMLRTERPVTVLFDDYTSRRQYARVERFVQPAELCGRMARFELAPTPLPRREMTAIMEMFNEPF